MDALTPDRRALRTLIRGNELPSCPDQVSLIHTALPSMHSVTKHLTRPAIASLLPTQRDRLPGLNSPGLVYDANNQVAIDPDKQVQGSLHLLFKTFSRTAGNF